MSESTPKIDPTLVALGGADLLVTFRDGRTETVKVRILEIVHFPRYLAAVMQDLTCADLVCGQAPGWSEQLSTTSVLDINDKAYELNFTNARRYYERRASLMEKLADLNERGERHLKSQAASSPSANSAPASV